MGEAIQQLGRVALALEASRATDAQLLERFLATHDETTFEVLVRRHGPMVLGVCRRALPNPQDAEDAFQATFLVLVRKADSIVPRGMVGNWLYGVAYQTALKARAMADKRRAREGQVMNTPEPAVMENDETLWRELRPIIDEELSRLPAKYRVPLVLCDIEEKSYKEAAEQLGWPEGTVAGRRARAMLADRLSRRGVVLPAVALTAILTHNAATASVPAALMVPTVNAATLVVAGQATTGAVSANVVALTEGVVKAMMLTKLKIATVVLLGACIVVSGMGFGFSPATADGQEKKAQPPAQPQPKDKKVDPKVVPPVAPNNGNDEKNGQNNQNGNDEKNGNNNQNGNDEKNGQNNQNGNDEQGVVKAINQNANTITVVVNHQGKPVEKVFALPKNVPVQVAGKPAKLGDLKAGMKVGVALDKDKKNVVGIKQVNEPNGPNNNGQNGNGQKNQKNG